MDLLLLRTIDEVALGGLSGFTISELWRGVSDSQPSDTPLDNNTKAFIWRHLIQSPEIFVFLLDENAPSSTMDFSTPVSRKSLSAESVSKPKGMKTSKSSKRTKESDDEELASNDGSEDEHATHPNRPHPVGSTHTQRTQRPRRTAASRATLKSDEDSEPEDAEVENDEANKTKRTMKNKKRAKESHNIDEDEFHVDTEDERKAAEEDASMDVETTAASTTTTTAPSNAILQPTLIPRRSEQKSNFGFIDKPNRVLVDNAMLSMPLDQLEASFGERIRIVASEPLRKRALGLTDPLVQINEVQYIALELIGRSRRSGILQKDIALQMNIPQKTVFYHLKWLRTRGLVTCKEVIASGTSSRSSTSPIHTNLVRLARFSSDGDTQTSSHTTAEKLVDIESIIRAVCETLARARDRVLIESDLRRALHLEQKSSQGVRWTTVKKKLQERKLVQCFVADIVDVDADTAAAASSHDSEQPSTDPTRKRSKRTKSSKAPSSDNADVSSSSDDDSDTSPHAASTERARCLRLLRDYRPPPSFAVTASSLADNDDDDDDTNGTAVGADSGGSLNALGELGLLHQLHRTVALAGTAGITQADLARTIGVSRKATEKAFRDLVRDFGVERAAETVGRQTNYRLFVRSVSADVNLVTPPVARATADVSTATDGEPGAVVVEAPTTAVSPPTSTSYRVFPETVQSRARRQAIVELLESERVLVVSHIRRMLSQRAKDGGAAGTIDPKTVTRLVAALEREQLAKTVTVRVPLLVGGYRSVALLLHPQVSPDDTAVQLAVARVREGEMYLRMVGGPKKEKQDDEAAAEVSTADGAETRTENADGEVSPSTTAPVEVLTGIERLTPRKRPKRTLEAAETEQFSETLSASPTAPLETSPTAATVPTAPSAIMTAAVSPTPTTRPLSAPVSTQQALRTALSYGFIRPKMVRARLLHVFLWQLVYGGGMSTSTPSATVPLSTASTSSAAVSPASDGTFLLVDAVEAMPVSLYLQTVGHTREVAGLREHISRDTAIANLPGDIRTALFKGRVHVRRLHALLDVLRQLRLVRWRPIANQPAPETADAMALFLEKEATIPATSLAAAEPYVFASVSDVMRYWTDLEIAASQLTDEREPSEAPASPLSTPPPPRHWRQQPPLTRAQQSRLNELERPFPPFTAAEIEQIAEQIGTAPGNVRLHYEMRARAHWSTAAAGGEAPPKAPRRGSAAEAAAIAAGYATERTGRGRKRKARTAAAEEAAASAAETTDQSREAAAEEKPESDEEEKRTAKRRKIGNVAFTINKRHRTARKTAISAAPPEAAAAVATTEEKDRISEAEGAERTTITSFQLAESEPLHVRTFLRKAQQAASAGATAPPPSKSGSDSEYIRPRQRAVWTEADDRELLRNFVTLYVNKVVSSLSTPTPGGPAAADSAAPSSSVTLEILTAASAATMAGITRRRTLVDWREIGDRIGRKAAQSTRLRFKRLMREPRCQRLVREAIVKRLSGALPGVAVETVAMATAGSLLSGSLAAASAMATTASPMTLPATVDELYARFRVVDTATRSSPLSDLTPRQQLLVEYIKAVQLADEPEYRSSDSGGQSAFEFLSQFDNDEIAAAFDWLKRAGLLVKQRDPGTSRKFMFSSRWTMLTHGPADTSADRLAALCDEAQRTREQYAKAAAENGGDSERAWVCRQENAAPGLVAAVLKMALLDGTLSLSPVFDESEFSISAADGMAGQLTGGDKTDEADSSAKTTVQRRGRFLRYRGVIHHLLMGQEDIAALVGRHDDKAKLPNWDVVLTPTPQSGAQNTTESLAAAADTASEEISESEKSSQSRKRRRSVGSEEENDAPNKRRRTEEAGEEQAAAQNESSTTVSWEDFEKVRREMFGDSPERIEDARKVYTLVDTAGDNPVGYSSLLALFTDELSESARVHRLERSVTSLQGYGLIHRLAVGNEYQYVSHNHCSRWCIRQTRNNNAAFVGCVGVSAFRRLNGELNTAFLSVIKRRLVAIIMAHPGITFRGIFEQLGACLAPAALQEALDALVAEGRVFSRVVRHSTTSLFASEQLEEASGGSPAPHDTARGSTTDECCFFSTNNFASW